MRVPGEDGRPPLWPALLALIGSVATFVLILGLASFLLRDVQFIDVPLVRPPVSPLDPTAPVSHEPLVASGLRSATTAIAPLVPICIDEARARDPSVPSTITLRVELEAVASRGVVRSMRIEKGASPFLQHCFNQRGVGVAFPVDQAGRATVLWRASVSDGAGVLELLPAEG